MINLMYEILKAEIQKLLPKDIRVISYGDFFLIELDKAFSNDFFERLKKIHPYCRLYNKNRLVIGNVNHDTLIEFFKRFKYPTMQLFVRTNLFYGKFRNAQLEKIKEFPEFTLYAIQEPYRVYFCNRFWAFWSQYVNSKIGFLLDFDEEIDLERAYRLAIKSVKSISNELIETFVQIFNPTDKALKEILMFYKLDNKRVGNLVKNTKKVYDLSEYQIPEYMKALLIQTFPTRFTY